MLRELATAAALLAAIAIAFASARSEQRLRDHLDRINPNAQRAYVQDQLIGSDIDLASLVTDGASPTISGPALLWILDLESCLGCFGSVGPWTRLEELQGHSLYLLLIGEPNDLISSRLRALRRTNVMAASREAVVASLGPLLPSTKLLVDSDDRIMLVDTRSSALECGWSFEAQVGALLGLHSSAAIRTPAARDAL